MKRKKLWIGLGIVVLLGAMAYANFGLKRSTGTSVTVEKVTRHDLEAIVSASGKIRAKKTVNISAETMGKVVNLTVMEGEKVKKGQLLLEIDPRNLETAVQNREASLATARSQLDQTRSSIESSKVSLKQAQDNLKRQQDLNKQGLVAREVLERAENDVKMRQTDLTMSEQSVRTQEQRIKQEETNVETARYDLNKVRMLAPIDGLVTARNIEEGETAVVGTMNNAGTVLLTIADMSVIEAEVEVDETDIPSVRIGQAAKVTIDALPDQTFTGKVTEIGNSPIQASAAGGARQATNFKVVVVLEETVPDVRPGFTCTAEITTAVRDDSVSVPIQATTVREVVLDDKGNVVRPPENEKRPSRPSAIPPAQAAELKPGQTRKELEGVFIVQNNKAVFNPVKTGIAGEKYFEVLSGLKEGDSVITGPFASVRSIADGAAVKLSTAPAPSESKPAK